VTSALLVPDRHRLLSSYRTAFASCMRDAQDASAVAYLLGTRTRPRRSAAVIANFGCDRERESVAVGYFRPVRTPRCRVVPVWTRHRGILQLVGTDNRPRRCAAVYASSCDRDRLSFVYCIRSRVVRKPVGGVDHFRTIASRPRRPELYGRGTGVCLATANRPRRSAAEYAVRAPPTGRRKRSIVPHSATILQHGGACFCASRVR
jgi:hypothetical protein